MSEINSSLFRTLKPGKPFEVGEMCRLFLEDKNPNKVNLSIGGYKDSDGSGRTHNFRVVSRIEKELANESDSNHEYVPFLGYKDLNEAVLKLLLGSENSDNDMKGFCIQSIGGTGPIRVGADFLKLNFGFDHVYYSDPTWPNHHNIFERVGYGTVKPYPYWDAEKQDLNFDAMIGFLKTIPPKRSIIILQAAAHNPTGIDPTREQWIEICSVMKERELFPFFDCAYQGFVTGDLIEDAFCLRHFKSQKMEFFVSLSFGKNLSLYGERIGFIAGFVAEASVISNLLSGFLGIIRTTYSSPPGHGAKIVRKIVMNENNFKEWIAELKEMVDRLNSVRTEMKKKLDKLCPTRDWSGLIKQKGMFYYSGLTYDQGKALKDRFSIYILPSNGRINIGAICSNDIQYICKAMAKVVLEN